MIVSAKWANAAQTLLVVVDSTRPDLTITVPADPANIDYAAILTSGTPIAPYAPPLLTRDDLKTYASECQARVLSAGITVNVGTAGASPVYVLCDGTSATRADLAMLTLWAQANPTGSQVWVDNSGVSTTLTSPQLIALATLIGTWITRTYAALAALMARIDAGSVTSMADIDTVVWPVI